MLAFCMMETTLLRLKGLMGVPCWTGDCSSTQGMAGAPHPGQCKGLSFFFISSRQGSVCFLLIGGTGGNVCFNFSWWPL